eukprot:TRINITY_DN13699_c0_g1_i5.p3 TRINITY_DN13699_c0_g1~~TRINITY_DN13699_c0_g1_i5.p3  ORF type:complete len:123 (+),score=1.24 TRINITY_DN13699_c0_g1_i5:1281-1649(+)
MTYTCAQKIFITLAYFSAKLFGAFLCISGPLLIAFTLILLSFHAVLYFSSLIPDFRMPTLVVSICVDFRYKCFHMGALYTAQSSILLWLWCEDRGNCKRCAMLRQGQAILPSILFWPILGKS